MTPVDPMARSAAHPAETLTAQRLWTVAEVAAYLRVSRTTVYTLGLRFVKIGNCRRYDPRDVDQYVQIRASRPRVA